MNKKKALIYARVSTDEQAQTGLSIDIQVKKAKEEIKKQGFRLVESPFIDEGKSGTNINRDGLQSLLARCKQGNIDTIVVQDTSRLSRNTLDYLSVKSILKDYNVQIFSLNQPMTKDDNPYSQFVDEVIAAANALQPRVTSMKVKLTVKEKFEFGWWPGWAPLGYKNIDNPKPTCRLDSKIVVPDPEIAPLIKKTFKLYSTSNYSMLKLCEEMYKRGLRSRTGKMVYSSTMQEMLTNPFYYGLMRFNGKEKKGKHKPLISKRLFDLCQYVAAKNRGFLIRERKYDFLLRSFVRCKKHNRRLVAEWHSIQSKKRNNKIAYYHCCQRGGCPTSYVEQGKLETTVANQFKKLQFKEEFIKLVTKKVKAVYQKTKEGVSKEKQAILNQIKGLEKKRNRLEAMLLDDTIERDTFKRLHGQLQGEIDVLSGRIVDLEQKRKLDINLIDEVLALTRNIHGAYLEAPKELKRHYLRFFFDRIYVDDKKLASVKFTPVFHVLKREEKVILRHELLPG